jgi:hypothetical protein
VPATSSSATTSVTAAMSGLTCLSAGPGRAVMCAACSSSAGATVIAAISSRCDSTGSESWLPMRAALE